MMKPTLFLFGAALLLPFVASQPGVNLVPFVESITIVEEAFQQDHCAVQEGSLGNEISPLPRYWGGYINRKLLRFSVGIQNKGWRDLTVDRHRNPDWFEWGACHRHWHFKDFTHYELLEYSGRDVVTGRKQAFCLMDIRRVDRGASSSRPRHSCGNPGISAGWADIYSYTLDGQWIDVTNVPPGTYSLRVTVNHGGMIQEDDYADNAVMVREVVIPQRAYRSGGGGQQQRRCHSLFRDCESSEDCCSEICAHRSGEIKTSSRNSRVAGGQCVCVNVNGRCAGDQNCCDDMRCNTRRNRCCVNEGGRCERYARNTGCCPGLSCSQWGECVRGPYWLF